MIRKPPDPESALGGETNRASTLRQALCSPEASTDGPWSPSLRADTLPAPGPACLQGHSRPKRVPASPLLTRPPDILLQLHRPLPPRRPHVCTRGPWPDPFSTLPTPPSRSPRPFAICLQNPSFVTPPPNPSLWPRTSATLSPRTFPGPPAQASICVCIHLCPNPGAMRPESGRAAPSSPVPSSGGQLSLFLSPFF